MKTLAKRQRSESVNEAKPHRAARKESTTTSHSAPSPAASRTLTTASDTDAASSAAVAAPYDRKPCKSALLVVSTCHAVMAGLVYRKEKFYIKFSVKRHVGRVNSVAVAERYIASSGVDERVFLFTNKAEERLTAPMRKKMQEAGEPLAVRLADLGSIAPPAEVTVLVFADGSQHLLCGCLDGQLLIYRCRDWSVRSALAVHEKALVGLAVHPRSHGSLAVTVGEDRTIAVLDLVKGKLLTKWKYNPSPAAPGSVSQKAGGSAPEEAERPSAFAPAAREELVGVLFSPQGTRLVVFSRFSFVVYDSAVMEPLCSFRCANPQPPSEMHRFAFFSETELIVGTEVGALQVCRIEETSDKLLNMTATLTPVAATYPESVREKAAALLATPVKMEVETRQKSPLRHVNRIKGLQVQGSTVFSIDSNGIVIAWNAKRTAAGPLSLQYVTSANCQGRVTGMELYPLHVHDIQKSPPVKGCAGGLKLNRR
ncbi:conserved hypothetical protein [Leishmania braziliensis MHOM/BR/75/M2904]|uniref:Uncharacterized protein n=2 Tax=Leishmania braziliensis TaxID=5660 RepID=A4HJM1_LEIBR|nr:conserved hypothetical protein [Leishmania braziliensis MHOM/BR/75/M2904]CAJ2478059.1 unnamed protein product [Leishmania braziliensis]CAM42686.2 conserved hypothetical protein [Leishmania braziliensis MHOM/BR/75/M2904]SYZ68423.1 hypothetical_protein [Leishmania braziliensis MHOM/BR/75/M2904]